MSPTMGAHENTLLTRKITMANTRYLFVGDAVVLKDPNNSDKCLVRRLAAEESFVLEKDQCWVVAENKEIKANLDHGPARNSDTAMGRDSPILAIELDVEDMAENHKAQ
ncbi:hypothetical protein Bca52824_028423 [Brassica carinata]|uniref:Uncharacterized protein n=1 Tax=Brassica carinata TaxID=52824 RepID=A0A8X7VC71_BRACI|nr:hypothetical protein Bca52824_028423 [Brassica carinata]